VTHVRNSSYIPIFAVMSSNSPPTILLSEEPDSISPFLVGDDFELPSSISPFIDDDFEVTGSTSLLLGDDFEETGSISLRLLSDDFSDDFEEIGSISPLLSDDTEESGLVPPRFLGGECAETGFIFPFLPSRECGPLKGSGNVPLVFEGAKSDLEAMKDSASQSLCNGTSSLAVVTHFGNYRQVHKASKLSQSVRLTGF
jgi:hypothetical protein